jgi:hypothetical protein
MLPRQARDKHEENSKKTGIFRRRCAGRRSGLSLSASGRRYFFFTHIHCKYHNTFLLQMLIRFGAKVELACIYSEQGEEQDDSELARVAKAELVHHSETAHKKTAPFSRSMMAVGSICICIHKDFTKTGSPEPTQTVQMRTDLSFCHVDHHRQENSVLPFRADPYGCKVGGVLSEKRAARDPTRRCASFCDAVLYSKCIYLPRPA